tara:strand:- start:630 stop:872 length:243 start_codon:yes stop_codon:yes gene_type:complete
MGRFPAKVIARKDATIIWPGIGRNAQNAPIAKPLETDFLFMCHKLGCRTAGPNIFKILSSLTVSNLGNNLLITFLIISVK